MNDRGSECSQGAWPKPGSSSSNSLGLGIGQGQARMYPRGGSQGQAWCRKPRSNTAPEWLGRALGMEVGLAEPRVCPAEIRFPWQHWCRDSGEALAHGWAEETHPGEAGQGQGGPMAMAAWKSHDVLLGLSQNSCLTQQSSLAGNEEALGFGFFAFHRQRAYSA